VDAGTTPRSDDHDTPPVVGGELETMLAFLQYLRDAAVRKLAGLSDAQARYSPVASGTSLLGLVKHLTTVEIYWSQRRLVGIDIRVTDALDDADSAASVIAGYRAATAATDRVLGADGNLDRLLARGRSGLTARWALVHLLEETGRHVGHADIVRELIDGSTGR
jgi:Protein of unknown function (DUF664)